MDGAVAAWEGVALSAHRATGIDAPVSAFDLADLYGLTCVPRMRGREHLDGKLVFYNASARHERQHGLVSHGVSHFLLRRAGVPDPEPAANYVAGALMLPRQSFDLDLRDTGWDLAELRIRHPNASAELIARRIPELRDAIVSIIDGRRAKRVGSPDMLLGPQLLELTWRELLLRDAVLETGKPQRAGMIAAYPIFDEGYRRVIVVAEARELMRE